MSSKIMYASGGAIVGIAFAWWFYLSSFCALHISWGVVDINALVAYQAQQLAKTTRNVSTRHLQDAHTHLKKTLQEFAQSHATLLLNKGALVGGRLPDYTAKIAALLDQNPHQQEQNGGHHD